MEKDRYSTGLSKRLMQSKALQARSPFTLPPHSMFWMFSFLSPLGGAGLPVQSPPPSLLVKLLLFSSLTVHTFLVLLFL